MIWMWLTTALAGPWVHEPGAFYARAGYDAFVATAAFDEQAQLAPFADERFLSHLGGVFDKGTFFGQTVSTYAEVGILPYTEVFGSVGLVANRNAWQFAQGDNDPLVQNGFGVGDGMIGLRGGYSKGSLAGSLGVGVRGPFYDNAPEALNMEPGNSDFYDDNVPLGMGTIDVEVIGAFGSGFNVAKGGWTQVQGGARFRNRGYSTVIPASLQVGLKPVDPLALMLNLDGAFALSDGTAADFYFDEWGKGPTIIDRQSTFRVGVGGMYDVWETLALEANVSRIVWGVRSAAGTGFGAGVSYRM